MAIWKHKTSPLLGDFLAGRENNFNLIRMIAALAVLISHSYPISQGLYVEEPLDSIFGFSLGLIAVYAFFILSGFLIANSYNRRNSIRSFIIARSLRILPGLFIAVCICAFVIGPLFTEISLVNYLGSVDVYSFVLRNISFLKLQYELPATFDNNVYPIAINGSLWTLPYEVYCYISLALVGYLGLFRKTGNFIFLVITYLFLWIILLFIPLHSFIEMKLSIFLNLSFAFSVGVGAFIYRKIIPINKKYMIIFFTITLLSFNTILFRPVFILALAYLLFWLSYVPKGRVRSYNKLGDYSYGIYIYAFPIQQSLIHINPSMTAEGLMLAAFIITLPLAVLSWHFIERPALNIKKIL